MRGSVKGFEGKLQVEKDGDPKVLLHSCCAPCSGAMVEEMMDVGFKVTIFFYNPNIHPRKEYEIRKEENVRFAKQLNIPFVDADYDAGRWYKLAQGMEYEPERGKRCTMCFDMRMLKTAEYAKKNGYHYFTTTNATSRWKDQKQVDDSGIKAAKLVDGPAFLMYDWQSEKMTQRKYQINAEQKFYKQEYCGCSFSLRDSNLFRKKQGLEPIVVGEADVYSNPIKDSMEEAPEVVNAFFDDSISNETEQWRKQRQQLVKRRKNGDQNDNW